MPPILSEYGSDSPNDPFNAPYDFDPFLDTESSPPNPLPTPIVNSPVPAHYLPDFSKMFSSPSPSLPFTAPQCFTPQSSQGQPNVSFRIAENMYPFRGWVPINAPMTPAPPILPQQITSIPVSPPYQSSSKRKAYALTSHEAAPLSKRLQRSVLDSNNISNPSPPQNPAETDTSATLARSIDPKPSDLIVGSLAPAQQLGLTSLPNQHPNSREAFPTLAHGAEAMSKRSQHSHAYLNDVSFNLSPRQGPAKRKTPIAPSNKVGCEAQQLESLKVVVNPRPPQYLADFKLYPTSSSDTKSMVVTRSRKLGVVDSIESSNNSSPLPSNAKVRQHRRPSRRKMAGRPSSAVSHNSKPPRDSFGRFAKRPSCRRQARPIPTREPTPELIVCIGTKVILPQHLQMLELIETSSKAALPGPERGPCNLDEDVDVRLDYSEESRGLVREWLCEDMQRRQCAEKRESTFRSNRAQSLTIATDPAQILSLHGLDVSDPNAALMGEKSCARLQEACEEFFDRYMRNIEKILSSSCFLPNLTTVTWLDGSTLHGSLRLINRLPLRHVTLRGANMNETFDSPDECNMQLICLDTDITCQTPIREETFDKPDDCSLESISEAFSRCGLLTRDKTSNKPGNGNMQTVTLATDVKMEDGQETNSKQFSLLCSMICYAAATLESLTWSASPWSTDRIFSLSGWVGKLPLFAKLRFLKIDPSVKYDLAWLNVLIGVAGSGMIRHLDLCIDWSDEAADWFSECGTLPYLTTLVLRFQGAGRFPEGFLDANRHIQRLLVIDAVNSSFLEERFFKGKDGKRFTNLTSLSLISKGGEISRTRPAHGYGILPQIVLNEISHVRKLEQLCLSVGDGTSSESRWLIDHGALLKCGHSLQNLKVLAYTQDTYRHLDPKYSRDSRNYYEAKHPRGEEKWWAEPGFMESEDWKERLEREWEDQHRASMLVLADRYMRILPKLEWLYIGQYPVRVVRERSGVRVAVLESAERASCDARLKELFGER